MEQGAESMAHGEGCREHGAEGSCKYLIENTITNPEGVTLL